MSENKHKFGVVEPNIEPEIIQIAQLLTSLIDKRLGRREVRAEEKDEELTVLDAAKIKGVSDRTVRAWIAKRKLPAHKTPGGGIRIYRSDLEKAA